MLVCSPYACDCHLARCRCLSYRVVRIHSSLFIKQFLWAIWLLTLLHSFPIINQDFGRFVAVAVVDSTWDDFPSPFHQIEHTHKKTFSFDIQDYSILVLKVFPLILHYFGWFSFYLLAHKRITQCFCCTRFIWARAFVLLSVHLFTQVSNSTCFRSIISNNLI